jgi:cation transport regulator ChaC
MKIFGYGSLLCEDSLKKTVSSYRVVGPGLLEGYKRVFCVKSPSRKNKKTDMYSSVLNLEKDENFNILGMLYEIPEGELKNLHLREEGYILERVTLKDGNNVSMYIYPKGTCYGYINDDETQKEYLDICIDASKKLGVEFLENFIKTTFIGEESVKDWLKNNPKE